MILKVTNKTTFGLGMNDYPSDLDLRIIKEWSLEKGYDQLMLFVKHIWQWADRQIDYRGGGIWFISTGGWSGNEEIMTALYENRLFWATCWESSKRGGHYQFTVPESCNAK
jgi:hypothetical protein